MRNKDVERILSNYKLYIDTCSLMINSNGFFELELIPLLLKNNKKLYVIENVRKELENLQGNPSKSNLAAKGLNNLKILESNNLIALEKGHLSVHADQAFISLLMDERRKNDVCLITEDKRLALDVIANIKNLESINYNYDIQALKIYDGVPEMYNLTTLQNKIGVTNVPEHQVTTGKYSHKLLISFVIDNSISMKGERMDDFKKAFKVFVDEMSYGDLRRDVEYEIVAFEDFTPRVLKSFKDEEFNINSLTPGKMPFLDKAINRALNDLDQREDELDSAGIQRFKSWLIVISDSQSFDDTTPSSERISIKKKQSGLLFLPFNISKNPLSTKVDPLSKQKVFIKVGENKFSSLSNWLIEFAITRLTTPIDSSVSIKKESFNGWAILK